MSDRKPPAIRRTNIESNLRNSQASALRQLRVVMRKVSRAVRDGKPLSLSPTELEEIERFYKIKTSRRSRPVGAPKLLAEFLRWMARDVYWWREELDSQAVKLAAEQAARKAKSPVRVVKLRGALKVATSNRKPKGKVDAANANVAKQWEVSRTAVEQAVRDHGADAQDWLKKFGADREATAVLIAQRAHAYRMLAIKRKREKEGPTQRARRDAERTSGGRMETLPPGREEAQARAIKIATETGDETYNTPLSVFSERFGVETVTVRPGRKPL